jgi:hypothetical protein
MGNKIHTAALVSHLLISDSTSAPCSKAEGDPNLAAARRASTAPLAACPPKDWKEEQGRRRLRRGDVGVSEKG